ncbi:MAG: ShlB/FhaC/HecB family hemolysin secretion/activation protein [Rubrivivax sp.]|nr:ShlB/FhaC/HecB family hemolysin secretion/activation protein [Rubrivivax sp.]
MAWTSQVFAQSVQRLPQDSPRTPQPASRALPLLIDRERFAEQAPPDAGALTFRLTAVELIGNRTLPTSQFAPMWAPLLGKEVTLAAMFDIAAQITAAYRRAGYILSQALVPAQEILQADGRVRIRVAEGFISQVTLGADEVRGARLLAMLTPIQWERPLTLTTLERHLLLVNDLPGVRSQAALRAGQELNSAILDLQVQADTEAFSFSVHNRTSEAVGPLRLEASAERRGLLGAFDRHGLRWVGSGNQLLNLLAYSGDAPLGSAGTQVSWSASTSRSRPKSGTIFQLDTDSRNASLAVSHPWLRARAANLTLRAALAGYDGKSEVGGGLQLSEERLRPLRLGLAFDLADGWAGVNLLDVEVSRGLSALGASRADDASLSRQGSNPQFTKTTLYAARLQSLGGEWSLLLAATGQATRDLLGSSEQLGLGGEVFLRAYDPSELLGDSGQAGKVELRRNFELGQVLAATLYAYYDAGTVKLRQMDGSQTGQSAYATGLGIRLSGPRGTRGFVEAAKPGHKPTARNGDEKVRIFAGLGIDF